MAKKRYFTRGTFDFLRDLAENNNREWFQANRTRYEDVVRGPAQELIQDFATPLEGLSPYFRADPRANGGSLFRIHRDTRFSKDKTPYKTSVGIQFRHEAGKGAHTPGFYLHVEPGRCFTGLGIWRPDGKTLKKIREGLVADPEGWKKALSPSGFKKRFSLSGDSLIRPPRGFDPEHPLVEDLKRKDFIATGPLTQRAVTEEGFLTEFAARCRAGLPFMRFLCQSLDLPC